MKIDHGRFLALVGTLSAGACTASTPAPTPPIAPPTASVTTAPTTDPTKAVATAAPAAKLPNVPGPHLVPGPCAEGGASWPARVACDDRAWEVDCARLDPPGVCSYATEQRRICDKVARFAKPVVAAMWIESMMCMAHGDPRFVCQSRTSLISPADVLIDDVCRRADGPAACARMAKSCAQLPAGDTSFARSCEDSIGVLNDRGVAAMEACVAKDKRCANSSTFWSCAGAIVDPEEP